MNNLAVLDKNNTLNSREVAEMVEKDTLIYCVISKPILDISIKTQNCVLMIFSVNLLIKLAPGKIISAMKLQKWAVK